MINAVPTDFILLHDAGSEIFPNALILLVKDLSNDDSLSLI